jgi:hypothetical protein
MTLRSAVLATILCAAPLCARTIEFRYALEMQRAGGSITVSPLGSFEAGDRLRVRLLAGQDSYCYLAVGEADGYFHLARAEGAPADTWVELPAVAWLGLDYRPGVEMVYLIVASSPVPELEKLEIAGRFPESALLRIRGLYQGGARAERVANRNMIRVRQKTPDDAPAVVLEPIRLRHR